MGENGGGEGGAGVRPVLLSGWFAGVSDIRVWLVPSSPRTRRPALPALVTNDARGSNVSCKCELLSFIYVEYSRNQN